MIKDPPPDVCTVDEITNKIRKANVDPCNERADAWAPYLTKKKSSKWGCKCINTGKRILDDVNFKWDYYEQVFPLMKPYIVGHPVSYKYYERERGYIPETPKRNVPVSKGIHPDMVNKNGKFLKIPLSVDNFQDFGGLINPKWTDERGRSTKTWIRNVGLVELHSELNSSVIREGKRKGQRKLPEHPTNPLVTKVVVDIDPDPAIPFEKIVAINQKVIELLDTGFNGYKVKNVLNHFTGSKGFHLIGTPEIPMMYDGKSAIGKEGTVGNFVCSLAKYVNKEFPDIPIECGGVSRKGKVIFDYRSCTRPTKLIGEMDGNRVVKIGASCIVPFSLRWETGLAAIPVDYEKIPDFNPTIHADPAFVMENLDLFR